MTLTEVADCCRSLRFLPLGSSPVLFSRTLADWSFETALSFEARSHRAAGPSGAMPLRAEFDVLADGLC